jgi:hypothetical protein
MQTKTAMPEAGTQLLSLVLDVTWRTRETSDEFAVALSEYQRVRSISKAARDLVRQLLPKLCVDLIDFKHGVPWMLCDIDFFLSRLELGRARALVMPQEVSVLHEKSMMKECKMIHFPCFTHVDCKSLVFPETPDNVKPLLLQYVMNPFRMDTPDDDLPGFIESKVEELFTSIVHTFTHRAEVRGLIVDFAAYYCHDDFERDLNTISLFAEQWASATWIGERMSAYVAFSLIPNVLPGIPKHRTQRLVQQPRVLQDFNCMKLEAFNNPGVMEDMMTRGMRADYFPNASTALRLFFAWPRFTETLEEANPNFVRCVGTRMHNTDFPVVGVRSVEICMRGRNERCKHVDYDAGQLEVYSTKECENDLNLYACCIAITWGKQHLRNECTVRTIEN